MSILSKRIHVYSDGSYLSEVVPSLQLWRVRHDLELGPLWRTRLPEVHPLSPGHFTPLSKDQQLFSFALNQPWLLPKRWTAVYSCHRAFTNNQAWDCRCAANFVEGTNLICEVPKQEALVCGGAYLKGIETYSLVEAFKQTIQAVRQSRQNILTALTAPNVLMVETLDGRAAPPTVEWLLQHPWLYFHAITIDSLGTPRPFPQADGHPIYIPLIADPNRYPKITIPLWKLEKLDMSQPLPSPYEVRL